MWSPTYETLSASPEADRRNGIGQLNSDLPRAPFVFREVDILSKSEGNPALGGIETPGVDVVGEPLGQPLAAAIELRAKGGPSRGQTLS
jgi:hypothetical protein